MIDNRKLYTLNYKKKTSLVFYEQKKICNALFSLTLSSALKSLTSVFGMGTGVSS